MKVRRSEMKMAGKFFLRFVGLTVLLLALSFVLTSCTCNSEGDDDDVNDDTDNDDTDDDDSDDTDDDDDAQGWHIYTIDTEPPYDTSTSIAIDSNNKVHIAYQDHRFGETKGLKYATNESGTWQKFIIDPYGTTPSLAIDSNDKLHISYSGGGWIKYAMNKTGSWQIFDVAEVGGSGGKRNNYLALDSNGKAHIAIYYCGELDEWDNCTVSDLEYATNQSGSWQVIKFDKGIVPSIAVDSNKKAHICYYGEGYLKHATNANKGWQKIVVDDCSGGCTCGGDVDCDIAVDKDNKLHISYFDDCEASFKYATNASGTWQRFTLESVEFTVAWDNAITVDSSGKVHISYITFSKGTAKQSGMWLLKYATNKSGTWEMTTIDEVEEEVYEYIRCNSIAIDSEGYVHISYIAAYPDALKYATNRPPE